MMMFYINGNLSEEKQTSKTVDFDILRHNISSLEMRV
jgi:hypothetical protein